ncbi:MAG: hypothetical protein ACK4OO_04870, partial [bacterium]
MPAQKGYLKLSILALSLFHICGWSIQPASNLKLMERVREKVLNNGMRIVVVERHNAPVFFSLIAFRVGSNQESINHSG